MNLSRAIGDLEYKRNPTLKPSEQLISCMPDVIVHEIKEGDQFLVMGCDGIWEMINGDFITKLVYERLKIDEDVVLSEIAENILDAGLAPDTTRGYGCDNMSTIVVRLDQFKN